MKALILNSGTGSRMGDLTRTQPKCMTGLITGETILSRQITQLEAAGIREIVITTGPFVENLESHARQAATSARLTFVNNPRYAETNYIYSIYLARAVLDDDLILLHGDLVFSQTVLEDLLDSTGSAMTVSTTLPLAEKDFKAVVAGERITAVGIEFFDRAVAAQPLYKLTRAHWSVWLEEIVDFVQRGETGCYAENALNQISARCVIAPFDVGDLLCSEVDVPEDLQHVDAILQQGREQD